MHPLFPSGDWEGFYTYTDGPQARKHEMHCQLNFGGGKVHGVGSDDVGPFSWKGTYNKQAMECKMVKTYRKEKPVNYEGHVDENGIWGLWNINGVHSGGFHLRPIKGAQSAHAQEAQAKKAKASAK